MADPASTPGATRRSQRIRLRQEQIGNTTSQPASPRIFSRHSTVTIAQSDRTLSSPPPSPNHHQSPLNRPPSTQPTSRTLLSPSDSSTPFGVPNTVNHSGSSASPPSSPSPPPRPSQLISPSTTIFACQLCVTPHNIKGSFGGLNHLNHLRRVHFTSQDAIAHQEQHITGILQSLDRWLCAGCKHDWAMNRNCRCGLAHPLHQSIVWPRPPLPPMEAPTLVVTGPPPRDIIHDYLRSRPKTVEFVPKSLRAEWNRVLSATLACIINDPTNEDRWCKLLLLPGLVLGCDTITSSSSYTANIRTRLHIWSQDRWLELLPHPSNARSTHPQAARHPDISSQNRRRCIKLAEQGRFGLAAKALTSLGLATTSDIVVESLHNKHPPSDPPLLQPQEHPNIPLINRSELVKAISSFPSGSAPGCSGLRAQHLKDAFSSLRNPALQEQFLCQLGKVVHLLLTGQAPKSLSVYLAAAPLTALNKKDGDVRPIAVGETIRRLVSKIAISRVATDICTLLLPHQVGINVRCGAEAIVHATSRIIESQGTNSDLGLLKIDFANAFNVVDRTVFLQQCHESFPSLSPWVNYCYHDQPFLWYQGHELRSASGVQQGDPLGPLLFCIALHPLILDIQASFPECLMNAWYLDDGAIIAPLETLAQVIRMLQNKGPALGIHLNINKCEVWWPSLDLSKRSLFPDSLPLVTAPGIDLLGSPLGQEQHISEHVSARVQKISNTLRAMRSLEDPQIQYLLLKHCHAFPKLAYALRTTNPNHTIEARGTFDAEVASFVEDIFGAPLSQSALPQATLPIRKGGLGLPSAQHEAAACYVASISQSSALQDSIIQDTTLPPRAGWDEALLEINLTLVSTQSPEITPADIGQMKHPQRTLSDKLGDARRTILLNAPSSTTSDRARILSCSLPHSGEFLHALPIPNLGLKMLALDFSTAVRIRLGLPVSQPSDMPQPCPGCNLPRDCFGHHSMSCKQLGQFKSRHNNIRDIVYKAASRAFLNPRREVPDVIPNSPLLPADILIPNWSQGRACAIDVSVSNPLSTINTATTANNPGSTLERRIASKRAKYETLLDEAGITFIPFVMETTGGLHELAIKTIKKIASGIAAQGTMDYRTAKRQLVQQISICLQRFNATAILSAF